ncbi:MAG: nucleotidyltransferase family protein [Betaproteobacteria bacterium]|nr:nucleotidyltransferase family protein [Betaproteobacteria bacterium]
MQIVGVLLAAGFSRRYGANKLIQRLPDGSFVAVAAGRNLLAALPDSIAVVRPDVPELATALQAAGLRVVICENAQLGMGASLAEGIRAAINAGGWVVALADMPFILPASIRAVVQGIEAGYPLVATQFGGERGHPVGFSSHYRAELSQLSGDEGARRILKRDPITFISSTDPGVIRDIDTPGDLPQ